MLGALSDVACTFPFTTLLNLTPILIGWSFRDNSWSRTAIRLITCFVLSLGWTFWLCTLLEEEVHSLVVQGMFAKEGHYIRCMEEYLVRVQNWEPDYNEYRGAMNPPNSTVTFSRGIYKCFTGPIEDRSRKGPHLFLVRPKTEVVARFPTLHLRNLGSNICDASHTNKKTNLSST